MQEHPAKFSISQCNLITTFILLLQIIGRINLDLENLIRVRYFLLSWLLFFMNKIITYLVVVYIEENVIVTVSGNYFQLLQELYVDEPYLNVILKVFSCMYLSYELLTRWGTIIWFPGIKVEDIESSLILCAYWEVSVGNGLLS